jgi:hypothetical protein
MDDPTTWPPHEVRTRFAQLQTRLPALWSEIGRTDPGGPAQRSNTVVVAPSISIDLEIPRPMRRAYEERLLFMTLLLAQPRVRIVYLTCEAIAPEVVAYYLALLPPDIVDARKRLVLLSADDPESGPLAQKLLARPALLDEIRTEIGDAERAHLVPFTTTDLERRLAVALAIPMYGADPELADFGTKSGGRRLFEQEGVAHPLGWRDLAGEDDLVAAATELVARRPSAGRAIAKLDEGVGGMGNAVVDLTGLAGAGGVEARVRERVRAMRFEVDWADYAHFTAKLAETGGVLEEFVGGEEVRSPSVQLRITPLGELEILSTHDQVLGGPSGQSFLGASFPAHPDYGPAIAADATKVGRRLAAEGVLGRFAVDFVVVRDAGGEWATYAIEINLRKGGTTAPFLTLQYLTDGIFDAEAGLFRTGTGAVRHYRTSDHVTSDAYRQLAPSDLGPLLRDAGLHYDRERQTGVVLHAFSAVGELGELGVTAIDESAEAAEALYQRFVAEIDRAAGAGR